MKVYHVYVYGCQGCMDEPCVCDNETIGFYTSADAAEAVANRWRVAEIEEAVAQGYLDVDYFNICVNEVAVQEGGEVAPPSEREAYVLEVYTEFRAWKTACEEARDVANRAIDAEQNARMCLSALEFKIVSEEHVIKKGGHTPCLLPPLVQARAEARVECRPEAWVLFRVGELEELYRSIQQGWVAAAAAAAVQRDVYLRESGQVAAEIDRLSTVATEAQERLWRLEEANPLSKLTVQSQARLD